MLAELFQLDPAQQPDDAEDLDDIRGDVPLPDDPTDAAPGSPEKVEVLVERARLKRSLWHPLDPYDVDPAPPVNADQEVQRRADQEVQRSGSG
jgi:hypothetical protein